MIEMLCDDSTGCKEAGNTDYPRRSTQWQMFDMSVTWMRISFDNLQ